MILLFIIWELFPVMEIVPPGILVISGVSIVKPESLKSLALTMIAEPYHENVKLMISSNPYLLP